MLKDMNINSIVRQNNVSKRSLNLEIAVKKLAIAMEKCKDLKELELLQPSVSNIMKFSKYLFKNTNVAEGISLLYEFRTKIITNEINSSDTKKQIDALHERIKEMEYDSKNR